MPQIAGLRRLQPVVQSARAALDLQASGQLAIGPHPAIDTVEHHGDETIEPAVDRCLVREHRLVGPHQFGDRKTGTVAHLDQFGGIAVIEGDSGSRWRCRIRLAFPPDETTAQRIPGLLLQFAPVPIECRKTDGIRMDRSRLVEVEIDIPRRVEIDGGSVREHELPGRRDTSTQRSASSGSIDSGDKPESPSMTALSVR